MAHAQHHYQALAGFSVGPRPDLRVLPVADSYRRRALSETVTTSRPSRVLREPSVMRRTRVRNTFTDLPNETDSLSAPNPLVESSQDESPVFDRKQPHPTDRE